ncbi:MAG: PQQ-binding-like beta-propeller repeat protein [Pseudomonadota bacterium]
MLHLLLLVALLAPSPQTAPSGRTLKIVQISDTHVGRHPSKEDAARLRGFLRQLVAQESPVDLWAFTGDLTHRGLKPEFEAFRGALDALPRGARVVLVKGNHDEGRPEVGGAAWQEALGDPTRAFDLGGYRIVTAPQLTDEGEDGAWLMKTLRAARKPVLLFVHFYPRSEWLDPLRSSALRAVFSGHWHGNQAVRSGDIYSFNTASATLGGWDFSPPVARVVELTGADVRSRLVPWAPRESAVAWSFGDRLLVQVTTNRGIKGEMHCSQGTRKWTLTRRGSYAWEVETPAPPDTTTAIRCTSKKWSATITPGDAAARGIRWVRALGRMQYGGGAAVAGDRVIVATRTGLDDDHGGEVHALDLESGATLWSHALPGHPAGRPAVDASRTYVQTLDGTIHAFDLATGAVAWTFHLADSFPPMFVTHWVGTGPALHRGRLYTCYQKGPYVVDALTGALLDREEAMDGYDVLGVTPARVFEDRLLCGTFTEGLFSWTLDPGGALDPSWKDTSIRVTAAPAADPGGRIQVRTLQGLRSYDVATGESSPETLLSWIQVPSSPLPLEEAVVTTGRMGRPAALRDDGTVIWTRSLGEPLATFELNRYDHPAPLASPVRVEDGVVIAGPDGVLRILAPTDGAERRRWAVGAPLAGTPAADGGRIVVTDLGGTTWCLDATDTK